MRTTSIIAEECVWIYSGISIYSYLAITYWHLNENQNEIVFAFTMKRIFPFAISINLVLSLLATIPDQIWNVCFGTLLHRKAHTHYNGKRRAKSKYKCMVPRHFLVGQILDIYQVSTTFSLSFCVVVVTTKQTTAPPTVEFAQNSRVSLWNLLLVPIDHLIFFNWMRMKKMFCLQSRRALGWFLLCFDLVDSLILAIECNCSLGKMFAISVRH